MVRLVDRFDHGLHKLIGRRREGMAQGGGDDALGEALAGLRADVAADDADAATPLLRHLAMQRLVASGLRYSQKIRR